MPDKKSEIYRNEDYQEHVYPRFQIRDCVKGSNAIKRQNEIYLPMPSGMIGLENAVSSTNQVNNKSRLISQADLPWYHINPAYKAYLHRARFPDLTANILRGIIGLVSKVEPVLELPSSLSYMEDIATVCMKDPNELFIHSVGEVLQTGKICYVLDINKQNKFKIAVYSAERNVDWEYSIIDGEKILTRCVFVDCYEDDSVEEESIEYKIENEIAVYQKYKGGVEDGEEVPITYMGKTLKRLPIFFAGVTDNTAETDIIPLLGVSDIALTIYRKDADLAQAQYMTCNPTLFIYGVNEDNRPTMIGSTVTVCLSNPASKAEYPPTDTSALDHLKGALDGLYEEAIGTASRLLGTAPRASESAEALSIREASAGASLVTIVGLISTAIEDVFRFAASLSGNDSDVEFSASLDFADKTLSPQMVTALVSSWVQGAISQDTLLDKFRDSNIVSSEVDNAEEKRRIVAGQEDLTGVADEQEQ